jgi:hypothetical protein
MMGQRKERYLQALLRTGLVDRAPHEDHSAIEEGHFERAFVQEYCIGSASFLLCDRGKGCRGDAEGDRALLRPFPLFECEV